jgi:hypothetical protein
MPIGLIALLARGAAGEPPSPAPQAVREEVVVTAERSPGPRETDRDWEELGLALPDFSGGTVSYYYPAAGFAARAGLDWTF